MNREQLMSVLIAPHVTEKTSLAMQNHNQYTFRVRRDATKTDIKKAVELMFDVKVCRRAGRERAGQDAPLRPQHRPHAGLEEGLREPGRRTDDRLRSPRQGLSRNNAWLSSNTSRHRRARARWSRSTARTCTRAARTCRSPSTRTRPVRATTSAASPRATSAAARGRSTASSTSSATRMASPASSSASSTTRTAPATSR